MSHAVLQGAISNLHPQAIHVHYLKDIKRQQQMAEAVAVVQAATEQAEACLFASPYLFAHKKPLFYSIYPRICQLK